MMKYQKHTINPIILEGIEKKLIHACNYNYMDLIT